MELYGDTMQPFPLKAFMDNYIWVISQENSSDFACVDPGDATAVLAFAKDHEKVLKEILLTHHHHDHTGGVEALLDIFPDCKIYSPVDARIPATQEVFLKTVESQNYLFEVLKTPGHTSTHISYYAPKPGWLFCGDTLFSGGCGRVFDGTLEALHQSINLYKALPETTLVFSAHEYTANNLAFAQKVEPDNPAIALYLEKIKGRSCSLPSTIQLEKKINPFLRTDSQEVQEFAISRGAKSRDSVEIFRILREEKNRFG